MQGLKIKGACVQPQISLYDSKTMNGHTHVAVHQVLKHALNLR